MIHLEPVGILGALLRCKDFDEALVLVATHVACVGAGEVAIEGSRVELREDVDLGDVAVEAVTNWDIDQPVVGPERHRGLCALLGQRVETSPGSAAKNNSQNTLQHSTALIDQP